MELRDIVDFCAEVRVRGRMWKDVRRAWPRGFRMFWFSPLAEKNPIKTPELAGARACPSGLIQAVLVYAHIVWKVLLARLILGNPPKYFAKDELLCITYFPYVVPAMAEKGVFESIYFVPLQRMWTNKRRKVYWLLIHVNEAGKSFLQSVLLARRFKKNGEPMDLLESFLTLRDLAAMPIFIAANWLIWMRSRAWIRRAMNHGSMSFSEVDMAQSMIRRSLAGKEAVRAECNLSVFHGIFRRAHRGSRCLYLAEMQSWEAAMNEAARAFGIRTVGYLHTPASRSEVLLHHGPAQMREMPLPDILLHDGPCMETKLREWGHQNAMMVESLRYADIGNKVRPRSTMSRRVLVVAGTIRRDETDALVQMAMSPAIDRREWDVWIKCHQSCPAFPWYAEAGRLDSSSASILGSADVVLTGTSSIAAEALAHGCDVILAEFPEIPGLNILSGHEKLYRKVYNPEQLASALRWNKENGMHASLEQKREFVEDFWCLNNGLSRWESALGME